MKRSIALFLLPLALFALERVNLIKDAGFEKDSGIWDAYVGGESAFDSAVANTHDPEKAFSGNYSGSCDTRKGDNSFVHGDSAVVIQGFSCSIKVSDLDSLIGNYCVVPVSEDRFGACWIALYIAAGEYPFWVAGYLFFTQGKTPVVPPPAKMLSLIYFPDDTSWHSIARAVKTDLIAAGIPSNSTVDSLVLMATGGYVPSWFGQKIYFDDIRLTGYADYDVGVKEILSGDSVWAGVGYTPVVRIKNFGREAADDFLVIAEIKQGETIVWADTVPYTLPADTEDTLEFSSFSVPDAASYTLTVRTLMDPDESDEDDQLSKPLYGTSITEQPESPAISLEVESFTANPRISYSLPAGQSGTISIYDATGRKLESLKVQGSGEVGFSSLAFGVYFVKLETGKRNIIRKAVTLR